MILVSFGADAPSAPSTAMTFSSETEREAMRSWESTFIALAMRSSHATETLRAPVSSRPIVWGVVVGSQRRATSSSVSPCARRTFRILVIKQDPAR